MLRSVPMKIPLRCQVVAMQSHSVETVGSYAMVRRGNPATMPVKVSASVVGSPMAMIVVLYTMVPVQMGRMLTTVRPMVAGLDLAVRVMQALRDRGQCIITTEMAIVTLCAAVQCAADDALSQLRPKVSGKKGARKALTAKKGAFERSNHFSDG